MDKHALFLEVLTQIDLEIPCESCGGARGEKDDDGEWQRCCDCGGSGFQVTEFGDKVLDLMRHNFKPMLQEVQDD